MQSKYTKAVRKRMRELADIAYERELRLELEKLEGQFQLWKDGKVDTFELEHFIHKFHNGSARVLYGRYTDLNPEMVLPYAITKGIISVGECPNEIIDDIRAIARVLYDE